MKSAVVDTKRHQPLPFYIEVYDRDPGMQQAVKIASGGTFPTALLDAIDRHTMTVYVVSEQAASVSLAHEMMRFAAVILEAGGLCVKDASSCQGSRARSWAFPAS